MGPSTRKKARTPSQSETSPFYMCDKCHTLFSQQVEMCRHSETCKGDIEEVSNKWVACDRKQYSDFLKWMRNTQNSTPLDTDTVDSPGEKVKNTRKLTKRNCNTNGQGSELAETEDMIEGIQAMNDSTQHMLENQNIIETISDIEELQESGKTTVKNTRMYRKRKRNALNFEEENEKSKDDKQSQKQISIDSTLGSLDNSNSQETNQAQENVTNTEVTNTSTRSRRGKARKDYAKMVNSFGDEDEDYILDEKDSKQDQTIDDEEKKKEPTEKKKVPKDELEKNAKDEVKKELLEKNKQYLKVIVKKGNSKEKDISEEIYQCPFCNFSTKHVGFFQRHLNGRHNKDGTSFWSCDVCTAKCPSRAALKVHVNSHTKPHMCEFCTFRTAQKKDLVRHVMIHKGLFPLKCDQCDYKCRQHKSLKDHMRKHTGEVFKCEVEDCNFATPYRNAFNMHTLAKHTISKKYQCELCVYKTNDRGSFNKHTKVHENKKEFKCSDCEYRAITRHDVIRHMRSHTKEKVYFCDRCQFSTSYSYGLKVHLMGHLGIKPWQCSQCGYNSITKARVIRHLAQRHKGKEAVVINLGMKLQLNTGDFRRNSKDQVVYTWELPLETQQAIEGLVGGPLDSTTVTGEVIENGEETITEIVLHEVENSDTQEITTGAQPLVTIQTLQQVGEQEADDVPQEQEHLQVVTFSDTAGHEVVVTDKQRESLINQGEIVSISQLDPVTVEIHNEN